MPNPENVANEANVGNANEDPTVGDGEEIPPQDGGQNAEQQHGENTGPGDAVNAAPNANGNIQHVSVEAENIQQAILVERGPDGSLQIIQNTGSPTKSVIPSKTAVERRRERLLKKVESQLQDDFLHIKDPEEKEEEIAAALEEAVTKILPLDRAEKEVKEIAVRAEALLERVKAFAKNAEDSSSSSDIQKAVANAEAVLEEWEAVKCEIEAAVKRCQDNWFRPVPCKLPSRAQALKLGFATVRASVKRSNSRLGVSSTGTPTLGTKVECRLFKVSSYIHEPFTGDGNNHAEILQHYRRWKGQWDAAEKKMTEDCLDVNDRALHGRLQAALGGSAQKMAAKFPDGSFAEAKEALAAKYDDVVRLTASYMATPATTSSLSRSERFKTVMEMVREVTSLLPTLQEEDVDPVEFFLVQTALAVLPSSDNREWRLEVSRKRRLHPNTDQDPFKMGSAFSAATFLTWAEEQGERAEQEDDKEDTSNAVFLASGQASTKTPDPEVKLQGCIVCGEDSNHRTIDCRSAPKKSDEEWRALCRKVSACFKCAQVRWTKEHRCHPTCQTCYKEHLTARHKPNKPAGKRGQRDQQDSSESVPKKSKLDTSETPKFSQADFIDAVAKATEAATKKIAKAAATEKKKQASKDRKKQGDKKKKADNESKN